MKTTKAGLIIIEDGDPLPQTRWRFEQIYEMIDTNRENINKIAVVIDKLLGRIEKLEDENKKQI